MSDTADFLSRYSELLVKYGDEHPEPKAFLEAHRYDEKFAELAPTALFLYRAINRQNKPPDWSGPDTTTWMIIIFIGITLAILILWLAGLWLVLGR
jgi:hypothetical protein